MNKFRLLIKKTKINSLGYFLSQNREGREWWTGQQETGSAELASIRTSRGETPANAVATPSLVGPTCRPTCTTEPKPWPVTGIVQVWTVGPTTTLAGRPAIVAALRRMIMEVPTALITRWSLRELCPRAGRVEIGCVRGEHYYYFLIKCCLGIILKGFNPIFRVLYVKGCCLFINKKLVKGRQAYHIYIYI